MRQLQSFLHAIYVRNTTNNYNEAALHAKLHGAEIASLESVLDVASEEEPFDEKTDKFLEERAKQILEERRNGRQWTYS